MKIIPIIFLVILLNLMQFSQGNKNITINKDKVQPMEIINDGTPVNTRSLQILIDELRKKIDDLTHKENETISKLDYSKEEVRFLKEIEIPSLKDRINWLKDTKDTSNAFILFFIGVILSFIFYLLSIKRKKSITKKEIEILRNVFFTKEGIAKGNDEIDNGNFELAKIYFKKELFKDPERPNVWVGLAQGYSGLGKYEDSLNAIRTAIQLDQKEMTFNGQGQISLIHAEILMKLNRFDDAKKVLGNDVLEKNPNSKRAKTLIEECKQELLKKRTRK